MLFHLPNQLSSLLKLLLLIKHVLGSEMERRLLYDLFEGPGYNPLIRPVKNFSDVIEVQMGITLFQVISVEERTQVMKTNNWIRMMWSDPQLTWDSDLYKSISAVSLPCAQVWKPDIVLLNNADGKYEQSYCSHLIVYSTGTVLWIPPAIYKSSCTIDVRYFPFDQQECSMKFGSWTYKSSQVELIFLNGKDICDLSNYIASGTWDLIGCPAQRKSAQYSEISYDIKLRRKTLFFTVNLLTPCILISFLSVLTFYLPADAQEKVTLCISILLALIVFMLLVSRSLPPTSVTIPLISKYLFFTFIMNIMTVVISVIIININFRSPRTYKMPRFVRRVFLNWLPVVLFITRPDHKMKYARWRQRKIEEKSLLNGGLNHFKNNKNPLTDNGKGTHNDSGTNISSSDSPKTKKIADNKFTSHLPKAAKAAEAVNFITQHLKARDDYDAICDDWRFVAAVIDRLLLYIFLVVTMSGTISIILDAPHILEKIDQADYIKELQQG